MTRRLFALLGLAPQTKTTTPVTPPPAPPAFFYREQDGVSLPKPDGAMKVFPLTFQPMSNVLLEVFLNGIFQREGAAYDYTYAAKTVTFNHAPLKGDFVTVQYWTQSSVGLF